MCKTYHLCSFRRRCIFSIGNIDTDFCLFLRQNTADFLCRVYTGSSVVWSGERSPEDYSYSQNHARAPNSRRWSSRSRWTPDEPPACSPAPSAARAAQRRKPYRAPFTIEQCTHSPLAPRLCLTNNSIVSHVNAPRAIICYCCAAPTRLMVDSGLCGRCGVRRTVTRATYLPAADPPEKVRVPRPPRTASARSRS